MQTIRTTLASGIFAIAASTVMPVQAQTLCEREIRAKLDELRIDPVTVTNFYVHHVRTMEGGSAGITGWVSLNTCRGKIVFNMGSSCRVYETYTMGECRMSGVSSY